MPSRGGARSTEGRPRLFTASLLATIVAAPATLVGQPGPGKDAGPGEPVEVVGQKFPENLGRGIEDASGWLPYYVELRSRVDRPVPVELIGSAAGMRSFRFSVRRRIEVSPGAPTRTWLYLRYEKEGELDTFRGGVRLKGAGLDRRLPDVEFHLGSDPGEDAVPMIVTGEHTRASASPWGDSDLEEGPRRISRSRIERMEEKELPDRSAGYHAARVLLLRNPDVKVLEPAQLEAIRRWVYLGGWAILVPSPKGEIFRTALFRGLLPDAEIGEPRALTGFVPEDLFATRESGEASLRRFAKADDVKPSEGAAYTVLDPVRVKTLREILSARSPPEILDAPPSGTVRLYYEAALGEGRVGVMTLDDMSFAGDEALNFRSKLWARILDRSDVLRGSSGGPRIGERPGIARDIRSGLSREIGVGLILLLVLVYLVVIGPGVYFVLKRLGRLPAIVWVEPLVVVAYLGIIAATAYITKGVLTRYCVVTVIERSSGWPFALKTSYLGLFSASDARYRIAAPGSDLLHPSAGGKEELSLELGPASSGPALLDYPIAQWGTATFFAQGAMDLSPESGIQVVELEAREPGKARLAVTNRTGFAIRKGFLKGFPPDPSKTYSIGAIPAGGRVEIEDAHEVALDKEGTRGGEKKTSEPAEDDRLLSRSLREILDPMGKARAVFAGAIEREERDFVVDRPSSLERRLDLYVEHF